MISDFIAGAKLPTDAKGAISKSTLDRLAAVAESAGLEASSSSKDLTHVGDAATTLLDSAIPPLIAVLYSGNELLCDALEIDRYERVAGIQEEGFNDTVVDQLLAIFDGYQHLQTEMLLVREIVIRPR